MYYSAMEDESVAETRARIYKKLKTKTSQSIPPEESFMLQAIKRIHYQLHYWFLSDIALICQRMTE